MRIVFMGTPDFAVPSLDILLKNGYEIASVVTAPDKPAGRGRQLRTSPVKDFALRRGLPVLQPEKLKDPVFLERLRDLDAGLFVVVAFRMLPSQVWQMPRKGAFNLHASLLPRYRGAAPINRAIMNGEKETGVTTFFIGESIDTGAILLQEKLSIAGDETAGELHDRLMLAGADLVLRTVRGIEMDSLIPLSQEAVLQREGWTEDSLPPAPKIFKEDCRIDWDAPSGSIHNLIRGLSPYPAAYTTLNGKSLRVFKSRPERVVHNEPAGTVRSDNRTYLKIAVNGGYVHLEEVQLEGKKRMDIREFLKGYRAN